MCDAERYTLRVFLLTTIPTTYGLLLPPPLFPFPLLPLPCSKISLAAWPEFCRWRSPPHTPQRSEDKRKASLLRCDGDRHCVASNPCDMDDQAAS